jgi:hypothetical protein
MASGHVNRTNRPNTWLHRPATRREDSPCQLGAVHTRQMVLQKMLHLLTAGYGTFRPSWHRSITAAIGARPDIANIVRRD